MNIKAIINIVSCFILILILSFIFLTNTASAETKTFIKEYTYHASDEDSRNSSRTIALREVKRLLLEELGNYLESQTEVKNFQMTKDQITTLTAGIVSTEVIEDKWDGTVYWLKAKIAADSGEVIKSIDILRKDRQKTKELEKVRARSDDLLKENERLRKKLLTAKNEKKQKDTAAYNETIKELDAADWFEKGYASFMSRNYKDAIGAYSKSIKLKPKDVDAYIMRGRAYIGLRNFNQAIKEFNKAIELNPQDAFAYDNRGDAYYKLDNYRQAVKDYDKAEEQNPYTLVNYRRGLAHSKLGNYKQAIEDFNTEIGLDPKNAAAYYNRGLAYDKLGSHNNAISDMKTGARLGHKAAQDYLNKRWK